MTDENNDNDRALEQRIDEEMVADVAPTQLRRHKPPANDAILHIPDNAAFIDGGDVSSEFTDVKITCPVCEQGTGIDPPRSECEHCGTVLALVVGHGPAQTEGDKSDA
jgi:hypothetical protein